MKQIYSLFTVLFLLSILLFSCSEENEEGCDIIKSAENNKYSVVIDSGSSAESRAITDLVQGGGNYSEGSLVKLYTKDRKFMATAVGSAGTTWLQNGDPNSTTILTSSINQDWSVAIKYYSDVILDCTAPGGDGSKVTKALEVGSQLPDPVVTAGYTFEGWYEGGTRVYIVPESSNRTFTAKFKQTVGVYYFSSSNKECGTISQSIAYIEDWRDLEEQSGAIQITVNPKFGYYFNGWTVKVPGSSSYVEVTKWWVDDKGTLIFNNGQVVDEYPSGSEFKAVFLASPAQPTYTITIHLAEWINGSWKNSIPTQYGVSWDKDNAYASMGTITLTKKFKAGDICTFWLVSSCDSYGCYMPQSITTVNHNIIDNIYGKYTYSFKVKSNTEYYVDITYIRND